MTMSGSKVEAFEEEAEKVQGIVVGRILSKAQHENADALFVCSVDLGGEEPVQIVTNAKNVKEGDLVPVATPGTVVTEGSCHGPETAILENMQLGIWRQDLPNEKRQLLMPDD